MKSRLFTRCSRRWRLVSFLLLLVSATYIFNAYAVIDVGKQNNGIVHVFSRDITKRTPLAGNLTKEESSATEKHAHAHTVTVANSSLHPDFKYVLENPILCTSTLDLKLLVLVHSAPLNAEKRQALRATWTNNSYFPELGPIRTLFLLGRVTNSSVQASLQEEFRRHGDILQGDFIDHYKNITYKGIMGYKWLTERCRNVKVILKVDDDIVVNTFKFMKEFVPMFLKNPRHIACRRLHNSVIYRNKNSKWFVQESLFKGKTRYPDFCQGFTVVLSNDIVPELYEASLRTEFFWIDDVFLYGLVPGKVKSIKYQSLRYGSDLIWGTDKPRNCYKSGNGACPYLAIMPWVDIPNQIRNVWHSIVNVSRSKA